MTESRRNRSGKELIPGKTKRCFIFRKRKLSAENKGAMPPLFFYFWSAAIRFLKQNNF
mgnify:CR=1 FL=1